LVRKKAFRIFGQSPTIPLGRTRITTTTRIPNPRTCAPVIVSAIFPTVPDPVASARNLKRPKNPERNSSWTVTMTNAPTIGP